MPMLRFILLLACPALAWSQSYPSKPVRLIVAFEAGSGGDAVARMIAARVGEGLGQTVVVENRGGAGGGVGAEVVARAAPDGYTLLFTTPNPQVTRPILSSNISYDPVNDFTPVTTLVETVAALVVHPSLPVSSMAEFVQYAKQNPGRISYASTGIGSSFHLAGEILARAAGVEMVHVPYKGSAGSLADLTAGRVQAAFTALVSAQAGVKAGKMRLLGVMGTERFAAAPDVPTIAEAVKGFENPPFWLAVFGPAGLQQGVVQRLNGEFVRQVSSPDMKAKLAGVGMSVIANSPEETAAKLRRDIALTARIVKEAGIPRE
jgi:tripartite-type tricarboxylate transporter receptor subunit TctC